MKIEKLEYRSEEVKLNNFTLVNAIDFVRLSSISHMKKVDQFGARFLNLEFGIKIYWCSIKIDGEEFDTYLANLGVGENQEKLRSALTYLNA